MIVRPLALVFQFLQAGMGRCRSSVPRRPRPSVSAAINRWMGRPHQHNRAKARRLKQIARLAPVGAVLNTARSRPAQ